MTVSERIRAQMELRGLSYGELAAATGLAKSAVHRYATGETDKIPTSALEKLAAAKVPILIVCGDSDSLVPFDENEKPFVARYREYGGPVEVIIKPGNDHHPHSLPDPKPIVDFFLRAQEKADAR